MPKYDIEVELLGQDGNANSLIGITAAAIRKHVGPTEAAAFVAEAMDQPSYDALLQFLMETVDVH